MIPAFETLLNLERFTPMIPVIIPDKLKKAVIYQANQLQINDDITDSVPATNEIKAIITSNSITVKM